MAIFSSSKKKKADATGASPPLAQGGPSPSFPRSQSGSFGQSAGFSAQQALSQHQSQPSVGSQRGDESMTSQLSQSQGAQHSTSPQIGQHPPSQPPGGQHAVLYPWSLRRLHLLPSSLLPPVDPSYPAAIPQTIPGPVSPPPFPRYGHSVNPVASAATGDLYVFGGLVQNAVKNDLYVLSCVPAQDGTLAKSGALSVGLVETRGEVPGPRVGHASVGVGNVLIVWGGDTKSRPEDMQDDGLYLLNLSESPPSAIGQPSSRCGEKLTTDRPHAQVRRSGLESRRRVPRPRAATATLPRWSGPSSSCLAGSATTAAS